MRSYTYTVTCCFECTQLYDIDKGDGEPTFHCRSSKRFGRKIKSPSGQIPKWCPRLPKGLDRLHKEKEQGNG